jgi:hypothetical protein
MAAPSELMYVSTWHTRAMGRALLHGADSSVQGSNPHDMLDQGQLSTFLRDPCSSGWTYQILDIYSVSVEYFLLKL